MKQTIVLTLAIAFLIIGIHQSFFVGILESYWLFMLAGICLLSIKFLKPSEKKEEDGESNSGKPPKKSHKRRKRVG